ncbi:MAG: glutamate--cysteine ligase [Cyanobacteria bacterium P01_A01_bin.114]
MNFRFGIEHEVGFLRPDGQFADFTNTEFEEFEAMVAQLPQYADDYPQLRIGDAGIKVKRWYIEGFERFSETGTLVGCAPKGIEIRTTIHDSIEGAIAELTTSYHQLQQVAQAAGFIPALTSFNPHQLRFEPIPPLNTYEQQRRNSSPEKQTAAIPMITYGPDLNLSATGLSTAQLIECGQKLTYYSPFIIPFSYSSPFSQSSCWGGLSMRTFQRTGRRPAAMIFLEKSTDLLATQPSLTKIARLPAEIGRIEFKAFDSCGDFALYSSLLALLKGLILDTGLTGRAAIPDTALHQRSAQLGFADEEIYITAAVALTAAEKALACDRDQTKLAPLKKMLSERKSPAQTMIAQFQQRESLHQILKTAYSP